MYYPIQLLFNTITSLACPWTEIYDIKNCLPSFKEETTHTTQVETCKSGCWMFVTCFIQFQEVDSVDLSTLTKKNTTLYTVVTVVGQLPLSILKSNNEVPPLWMKCQLILQIKFYRSGGTVFLQNHWGLDGNVRNTSHCPLIFKDPESVVTALYKSCCIKTYAVGISLREKKTK